MYFRRTECKCSGCPLVERKRVWGEGNFQSRLALFGEAPGKDEDESGHPFVGAAGRFLNWGLFESQIIRSQSWVSNILSCRPPGNEFDGFDGQEAQRLCRKGFDEEIRWLKTQGVTTVLALGNHAMRAFGIEGSIWKNRGSVFQRFGLVVIPTFHPSYLNRQVMGKKSSGPGDEDKGTNVDPKFVWLADLTKGRRLAQDGWSPPREDFEIKPTLGDLTRFRDDCLGDHRLIAVDIETTGFHPDHAQIVVLGLADSSEHGMSVPMLQQGGGPYWKNGDQSAVQELVSDIFQQCPLMFQNAQFDVPFLMREGYNINWNRVRHDSMILHHTISPELPHNLGFIVSLYGDTPYWKEDLLGRTGSILQMDNKTLRTYNLRDCVVLHQVLGPMLKDLREDGLEEIYENEALALIQPVGKMEQNGVLLDPQKLQTYKKSLEKQLVGLERSLRANAALPEIFNLGSDDDLRWFLYGDKPNKFARLEELKDYDLETTARHTKGGDPKVLKRDTQKYRDLLALVGLRNSVRPLFLPIGFSGRKTKKGKKRSVDEQGRLSLQIAAQNRLEEILHFKKPSEKHLAEKTQIERLLDWLQLFNQWAQTEKLLSTYTSYPIRQDGRVHGQFLIHGTATGRLASRNPNMQNLPKKDIKARRPFVASPGHTLLSADYSNLEVRVLAYVIQDPTLIQFLEAGGNIHDVNTRVLFGLTPLDPEWDAARHAAKIFQFGRIQYGGTDREIFQKVSMEVPELRLTFDRFKQAVERYMEQYPKYREWYERIEATIYRTRTTSTFHGRVRQLMGPERDLLKQALNTPIQGGAGAIINRAMIRIDSWMEASQMISKMILQVHDELVFDVWLPELESMTRLVRKGMEWPVSFDGVERVFPIEIELGPSLGELEKQNGKSQV